MLAYARSGSSFLGDIMQSNQNTFYSYEPLHFYRKEENRTDDWFRKGFQLLQNLYKCNFGELEDFLSYGESFQNFVFKRNHLLWQACDENIEECMDAELNEKVCRESEVQLVKEIRIPLRKLPDLLQFLDKDIADRLKIVYLVRDPRSMINSRKHMGVFNKDKYTDSEIICPGLESDWETYKRLKEEMPDRLFMIKYEDYSMDPVTQISSLFNNMSVPFSRSVMQYIGEHVKLDQKNNNQSKRKGRTSGERITAWVDQMSIKSSSEIQKECRKFLEGVGYPIFTRKQFRMMKNKE